MNSSNVDDQSYKTLILTVDLRHAKGASGAPWVRFFGKSIHARNFCYDVMYMRPPVQTVGVEVGKLDSL